MTISNLRQYCAALKRASRLSNKIAYRDLKTEHMRAERDKLVHELGNYSAARRELGDCLLFKATGKDT